MVFSVDFAACAAGIEVFFASRPADRRLMVAITAPKFTEHVRYLKWRNPHRDIRCMDTAYLRENPPPK